MSQFVFKMPDLGEGTVDAEIVAWHAKPGDAVEEDQLIVEVMTDKAAVEVPAPVSGRIVSTQGAPGDKVAVGSPFIVFELSEAATPTARPKAEAALDGARQTAAPMGALSEVEAAPLATQAPAQASATQAPPTQAPAQASPTQAPPTQASPTHAPARASATRAPPTQAPAAQASMAQAPAAAPGGRVKTSPANRRRASEAGIDLTTVAGSGPGGRIMRGDLEQAASQARAPAAPRPSGPGAGAPELSDEVWETKIIGLRRVIAERMSEAKRTIPHFAYVEEVDVTELESLRDHLNHSRPHDAVSLSYLPLVVAALTRVLAAYPQCNVTHDAGRGVLKRHHAVHVGIATQTPDGLKVPVIRHAEAKGLWQIAEEIRHLAEKARANRTTREELSGSTITVTSLGKLGGIASTPIINAPEVAIIGLNKAVERPMVHQGAIAVRRIMNLSSSFDHRFVDGYDAAAMIQSLKAMLEHPATIFIPKV